MTGRHLCGFYVVAVPDEYLMYARKEAERKHSKSLSCTSQKSTSQSFFDVPENLAGTIQVNSTIGYNSILGLARENAAEGKQTLM